MQQEKECGKATTWAVQDIAELRPQYRGQTEMVQRQIAQAPTAVTLGKPPLDRQRLAFIAYLGPQDDRVAIFGHIYDGEAMVGEAVQSAREIVNQVSAELPDKVAPLGWGGLAPTRSQHQCADSIEIDDI